MIRKRLFWILVASLIAGVCAAFVYGVRHSSLSKGYVISRVNAAKTPTEERAAFRLVRQFYPHYRVESVRRPNSEPAEGEEMFITIGTYEPVTDHSESARRVLLASSNLEYLVSNVLRPVKY
jgi:hypothetical protein